MLYRLKGELLLGQAEANRCYHEAEKCFERAFDTADLTEAKTLVETLE